MRAVLTVPVAVGLKDGPVPGEGVGGDFVALWHHGVGVPPGHTAGPTTKPLPPPGLVNCVPAVFAYPVGGRAGGLWGDVVAPAPRLHHLASHAGYLRDLPEGTAFTQGDDFSFDVLFHSRLTVLPSYVLVRSKNRTRRVSSVL